MKTTLKIALLASVLMATPVLAADMNSDDTRAVHSSRAMDNADNAKLDANGNPVPMRHHMHHMKKDGNYINHDANPNYGAENMHHGYRDANGNWHRGDRAAMANDGRTYEGRQYGYNNYYNRTAEGKWMGIDFNSRHMTDGSDTDVNNRGRHSFIFGDNESPNDFRVGSGHVVKF